LDEAEAALMERPVVAVVSTSPPVATHLVARRLKRRFGVPWVADFRDPLRGNPFRTRRWFFPYDALLERMLFRNADALIANTDTLAEMWNRRYPEFSGKMSVIWNGFDPEDRIAPAVKASRGRRVLAHVGTLYGGRHPGRVLSSLVRLIDQLIDAGLVTRNEDINDRRAKTLHLTAEGRKRATQLEKALVSFRRTLFRDIPQADVETSIRVLDELSGAIAKYERSVTD